MEGGKITNRKSLERVAQQTGKDLEELLAIPEVPQEILYLFVWFCQARGSEALTYQEIEAWDNLTGHGVTPEESESLMLLDCDLQTSQSDG